MEIPIFRHEAVALFRKVARLVNSTKENVPNYFLTKPSDDAMQFPRHTSSRIVYLLLLAIALTGCGADEKTTEAPANKSQPPPAKNSPFVPVSFQPQANVAVTDLEGLPSGSQNLGGVDYRIDPKLLHLGSSVFPDYPKERTGISVGKTCRAIHFLHSSQGGAFTQPGHPKHENDGVEIGRYVMHYADGSEETFPIIYGRELRGWWDWDNNAPTTNSQIVWTGNNPEAGKYRRKIRLYWAVWENPYPEKPIETIDFVSSGAKAAPFCLAMTLEVPQK